MERSEQARLSNKQRYLVVGLILFLFLGSAAPAVGAEFFWSTAFNISEEYDDNISLKNEDTGDDFITEISQDFILGIETEKIRTSINFGLAYAFYQERENTGQFRTNFNLNGFRDIPVSDNWFLDLNEFLNISEDPIELTPTGPEGEPLENYRARESRNQYIRNLFRGQLSYMFGEEDAFYWGYSNTLLENTDQDIADSMQHEPFAGLTYWFNVRHGFDVQVSYAMATFEETADGDFQNESSDFQDITLSPTYYFRSSLRTMWYLSYSYSDMDFEDQNKTDYSVHTFRLGVSHQFTETLSASAYAGYFIQDQDDGTLNSGQSNGLTLTKAFEESSLSLTFSTGFDEQYFDAYNLGANEYRSATVRYRFTPAEDLGVVVGAGYTENDYFDPEGPASDKTWFGNVDISYQLTDRLQTSLNYEHHQRESDGAEDEGYKANRIMLRLSIPYAGKPIPF